jgi:hypothetical protein
MNDDLDDSESVAIAAIAAQLARIADALERIAGTPAPTEKRLSYSHILANVSMKFGSKRKQLANIVYGNRNKHPKEICEILKAEGLLSPSTNWRDVKALKLIERSQGLSD